MEDIYECYAVVRLQKPDCSRPFGSAFPAIVELFDYDEEAAKKRAIEMSEGNFHERIFVFKQVYDIQDNENPVVGIRLKSGKRLDGERKC